MIAAARGYIHQTPWFFLRPSVALAGYPVHDLYESLPFVVIDSLEALDSVRIAALVEYFGEYAEYLVVALLPEDAAALDGRHRCVTQI